MLRYALAVGRTPGELEQSLSSAEWSELLAWFKLEPLPDHYWIGAQICAVMHALWSKSHHQVDDFIPRTKPPPQRLTPEESAGYLRKAMTHG